MRTFTLLVLVFVSALPAQDRDGDGLSDFHEKHKYFTNPDARDSDGDGTPDGDALERREYQYVIRSVVQVMRPVTIEYLNDDYQDARVLDETDDHVELEVIHYPFNTVAEALAADPDWRESARSMKEWVAPGPSADWTPKMRRDLTRALEEADIDVRRLTDLELAKRASSWLVRHAKSEDGFASFITAWDESGRPHVPDALRDRAVSGEAKMNRTLEEQWEREVSARGMFENGVRGSCTSSAIYMNGCLRAVGLPTRIILTIPVIDASDEREREMVRRGISHNGVRKTLTAALARLEGSWASHTYNEVWVGKRWRRLNYDVLGQNILDAKFFGLMTHVATFNDWADARMPDTIGRRQNDAQRSDLFGGPNPYSCISLRDAFGVHCKLENPPAEVDVVTIERLHWFDAETLPAGVRAGLGPRGRWGLVAEVTGFAGLEDFLARCDRRVNLESKEHPDLGIGFDRGCWWLENDVAFIYVPFGAADRRDLVEGAGYRFVPRNETDGYEWRITDEAALVRR